MKSPNFPKDFPHDDMMLEILKNTFAASWKISLDIDNINKWLDNFTGEFYSTNVERRLALWLLCNFTYYNNDEVKYLCAVLFKKFLHTLLLDYKLESPDDVDKLLQKSCFISIGKASESGGMILYFFRQEARLGLDRFFFPTLVPPKAEIVVCIDDVMLSGNTACRFFKLHKALFEGKKVYYLSLFTTPEAIKKFDELGIKVISCSKLDDRNKAFSETSLAFYRFPTLREPAKELVEGYGQIIQHDNPLGYENGQFCFGLYYNIPNNSLPIFWSSTNWNPIFERKEKIYHDDTTSREYPLFI